MPEGDTLHRAARRLDQALAGRQLVRFATGYAHLAVVDDQTPLVGRTVLGVRSIGKHLLFSLSGDLTLHTHLRMSGSWHLYRPGERWRLPRRSARLELGVATIEAIGFDIPVAELLTHDELLRHPQLSRLGPDLLAPAATFEIAEALRRLRSSGARSIAETLLDQRTVAGIGNIFKSEVLFLAAVDPFRPTDQLDDGGLGAILTIARRLLAQNAAPGAGDGITTYRSLRQPSGGGESADRLWVYGRGGRPCRRCGTPIAYRKQGEDARGTYWCPSCQR